VRGICGRGVESDYGTEYISTFTLAWLRIDLRVECCMEHDQSAI
jgi:hypothetical protein